MRQMICSLFLFAFLAASLAVSATGQTKINWDTQADAFPRLNGDRFTVQCPPGGTLSDHLWGTDLYTDDSSVCTAAVHAGAITARAGGPVTFEIRPGASQYVGRARNGVTSRATESWAGSFVIVPGSAPASRPAASASTSPPRPAPAPRPAPVTEVANTMNVYSVGNNPPTAWTFTLTSAYMITSIMTYHWNNGRGTAQPGKILLLSESGQRFGPWGANGAPGQGGVPNAVWECQPQTVLPAGTYTVVDSDPPTWSQNRASGGRGMGLIKGYPASGGTPAGQ